MTPRNQSNRIGRLWTAVVKASAAAVAIHYTAPWDAKAASRGAAACRGDGQA